MAQAEARADWRYQMIQGQDYRALDMADLRAALAENGMQGLDLNNQQNPLFAFLRTLLPNVVPLPAAHQRQAPLILDEEGWEQVDQEGEEEDLGEF